MGRRSLLGKEICCYREQWETGAEGLNGEGIKERSGGGNKWDMGKVN